MAIAAAPGCGFNSSTAKPGPDAGVDTPGGPGGDGGPPPDGPPTGNGFCYGPSGWQVCLDAKPTKSVQLQGMQGTLDTSKSDDKNPCLSNLPTSWTASQPDACIIVGDTVNISSLDVIGSRPLVIVAQTSITVTGLLDVASHRATGAVGAGSASGDCKPFGGSPDNGPPGAGGAGGSFMVPGGNGGTSDGTVRVGGQAAAANVGASARLRGGCVGQPGGGGNASDGGAGGGAVYLVSAGTISLSGKIDVSGAGGKGKDAEHGGGGGGSGGMIVVFAPFVMTMQSTILIADGGGGGGGGSAQSAQTTKGDDGHEPVLLTPIVPALGGTGGLDIPTAFNGGDGGDGYPAFSNMNPLILGGAGDQHASGGGGGGGGGYIRSNQDLGMAAVSPPADIVKP